jgi:hypothetical protein
MADPNLEKLWSARTPTGKTSLVLCALLLRLRSLGESYTSSLEVPEEVASGVHLQFT